VTEFPRVQFEILFKKREAMKKLAALTLSLFLSLGTAFADSPKDTPKDTPKADAQPAKTAPAAKPTTTKSNAEIAAEMEELRQTLQAQQEQLQMLKEELAKRDKQIEEAKEAAASANSRATEASVKATEAVTTSAEIKSTTSALNTTVASMAAAQPAVNSAELGTAAGGQGGAEEKGPLTLRYKGVNITPGGFLAAETVWRSHAMSGDIATPFNQDPFTAADVQHLNENAFSGRQSRLTLLIEGKAGSVKGSGYFESDFLGAGTTSNNRQTNSYVYRQRQLWGQAALESGWIFTGGQMWSLTMENKKGIQNRGENTPMMIDPNYVVGMTWQRAYAFRVVKDFGGKFALGASIEGPQATIGGRGFSSFTTINNGLAPTVILTTGTQSTTTAANTNFFINAPGQGGGLLNTFDANGYTVNIGPDLVFKAAADPGFGHYEVLGIVSFFRDRIYPCGVVGTQANDTVKGTKSFTGPCGSPTPTTVSSFGAFPSTAVGGGFGASAFVPLGHKVDIGVKAVAGDGIGRYGSAQLFDATARPDGSLALIRNAQGLARIEFHPTPKFDIYAYWGLEYAWRAGYKGYTTITVTKTAPIPATPLSPAIPTTTTTSITTDQIGGYGNVAANNSGCATEGIPVNQFNPSNGSNCAGDIRIIKETTVGFWHKFYQGDKGRVQWGLTYSYLVKNAWSGTGGPAGSNYGPKANDNMIWTSFRYYLP
jgi:hypothetical protein